MRLLVTGGAGFIGSHFVDLALSEGFWVVVLDALTYAGHLENLADAERNPNYRFVRGDIADSKAALDLLVREKIDAVLNFAAESHVDKSIAGPRAFLETNVLGTFELLSASLEYFRGLDADRTKTFRFLHVSTDEVFGSLEATDPAFQEDTPYRPNSPYSASKAASDHLVRAWHHTYGLPTLLTNCSNNYGPRQFPEKLIPHLVFCALSGRPLPVYGRGENIRDWISVEDHCRGIMAALKRGTVGDSYCFGGRSERKNLDVVHLICDVLDRLRPKADGTSYRTQIRMVEDRPGHDLRYAIDDRKAERELGFTRKVPDFEQGLEKTIVWYLDHLEWSRQVLGKGAKTQYDWGTIAGTSGA
jgi:dTDP-glucose 4,6-dehydratase